MDTIDMDEGFGQLRALMQAHAPVSGEALMTWLTKVEAYDPDRYHTQWVPYLAGFPHHWVEPLTTVDTIEALELAAHVAPFAMFAFDGSAWSGLARFARQEGKLPPTGWPPGFLNYYGFNDDKMLEFVKSEALSQLVHLNLVWGNLTPAGIATLADCPWLKDLKRLELRYHYSIKNEGIEALIASRYITQLEHLDVSQTHADSKGFQALAQSDFSRHLRSLHYWNDVNEVSIAKDFNDSRSLTKLQDLKLSNTSSQDISELFMSPNAATLRTFEFNACDEMTPEQFQLIITSPYLTQLEELNLSNLALDDRHMKLCSKSQAFDALHTLDLSENTITSEGIKALTEAAWMRGITSLNLSNNPLDTRTFEHLAQAPCALQILTIQQDDEDDREGPHFELDEGLATWLATPKSAALTHLDLTNTHLSTSLYALANAHHIKTFQSLNVQGDDMDAEGLIALLESPVSDTLETLDLSFSWYDTPEALTSVCQAIARSNYLTHLTRLDFGLIDLHNEALIALSNAPQCASLTYLDVSGDSFSDAALKVFASSPHFSNLTTLKIQFAYSDSEHETVEQWKILRHAPHLRDVVRDRFDPELLLED